MSDQGKTVIYIPPNFKEGASIAGIMIKPKNIIQAVPFIAILSILVFGAGASMSATAKLIIMILAGGPLLILAAIGINGDSLFGFLINMIRTRKRMRICLYNPRVKTEIKSLTDDPLSVEQLPREKILAFIEKQKSNKPQANYFDIDLTDVRFLDDEFLTTDKK